MTCLACDCSLTLLDQDWGFRTGHNIEPNLGHLSCKGKGFDAYFPDTFINYANGELCCTECRIIVPKNVFEKACFISEKFKVVVERSKKFYQEEVERIRTDQSAVFQGNVIITGDQVEKEFLDIRKRKNIIKQAEDLRELKAMSRTSIQACYTGKPSGPLQYRNTQSKR